MTIGDVDDLSDELQRLIVAQFRYNRAVKWMSVTAAWIDATERVVKAIDSARDAALLNAQDEIEADGTVIVR